MTNHKYYPFDDLTATLDHWSELHLYLDSGEEKHVHSIDTEVLNSGGEPTVVIDSKTTTVSFPVSKIEWVEYPISE